MSAAPPKAERCQALKRDGSPCTAKAVSGDRCIGHRPGVEDARRKGGAATSRAARADKLLPARLQPTAALLEQAMTEVHSGTLTASQGSAMAALASALVKILASGEYEERIRLLEERANQYEGGLN